MVRLLTGDETGVYKDVSLEKEHAIRWGQQSRRNGITHMRWSGQADAPVHRDQDSSEGEETKRLYKAREAYLTSINRSGVIQTWESSTQKLSHEFQAFTNPFATSDTNGTTEKKKESSNGNLKNDLSELTPAAVKPSSSQVCVGLEVLPSGASENPTQFPRGHPTKFLVGTYDGGVRFFDLNSQTDTPVFYFSAGNNVEVVRSHSPGNVIATSGKENLLRLWDMETQKHIFQSKNVPHNNLNMRVPYWDTDAQFWEAGNDGSNVNDLPSASEGKEIVTCGKHGYIRLYDIREKRRPVHSFSHGEWPFNRIIVGHDKNYVYVCDTTGELHRFDLRNQKLVCSYKGHAGSIRDLSLHPRLPLIASGGMGRSLFVHHTETRELVKRVYMKQKINSVLFTSEMRKKSIDQGIPVNSSSTAVNLAKRSKAKGSTVENDVQNNSDTVKGRRWAAGQSAAAFSASQNAAMESKSKFWEGEPEDASAFSSDDDHLWETLDENAAYNQNDQEVETNEDDSDGGSSLLSNEEQEGKETLEQSEEESSSGEEDLQQSSKRWAEEWAEESDNEQMSSEEEEAAMLVDSKKAQHKMKKETTEARRAQARTKTQAASTSGKKRRKK